MLEPKCRLTIADKYYGGKGGSGGQGAQAFYRKPKQEWPVVRQWARRWTEQEYPRYRENEPIVAQQYDRALNSPILAELGTEGLAQLKAGPSPLVSDITTGARAQLGQTSPLLREMQTQAQSDLARRGALSPEEEGRVRAGTLATAGSMGMGWTPGTLGTALLGREAYRQQREGVARQFATGVEGLSEQDISRRFGLATGAEQTREQDVAQRFAQAIGAETSRFQLPQSALQTGVSTFGQLTNPILDYLGKAFTPQVVGAGPADTTGSSAIGAIGSVLGAAITAY